MRSAPALISDTLTSLRVATGNPLWSGLLLLPALLLCQLLAWPAWSLPLLLALATHSAWRIRAGARRQAQERQAISEALIQAQRSQAALERLVENLPVGVEEQLQRSEQTMRLVLEYLPVGVWLTDPQGNLVYGNPEGHRVWGLKPDDPPGILCQRQGWWADNGRQLTRQEWALPRALREKQAVLNHVVEIKVGEEQRTLLNSAVPIYREEGTCEGAILITQDISQIRRVENALLERDASLAKSQTQAKLGGWSLELATGRLKWSDECYRIFGLQPGTPVDYQRFQALLHPEERERVGAMRSQVRETPRMHLEYRILVKGKLKWLRQITELEYDEAGQPSQVVGMVQDITELKLQEQALRQSQEKLRSLVAHQERIREQERARIAREIHDELGQQLTALRLDTAMIQIRFGKEQEELALFTSRMKETIDSTISMVRNVASSLRPGALNMGLISATEWQLARFQELTGVECHFQSPDEDLLLDDDRATAIFRILQESLTNIARHARASHVWVEINRQDDRLELLIRDDGVGFDHARVRVKQTHGLMGIRERALMLGGQSSIESRPGKGACLTLRLPLSGEQDVCLEEVLPDQGQQQEFQLEVSPVKGAENRQGR